MGFLGRVTVTGIAALLAATLSVGTALGAPIISASIVPNPTMSNLAFGLEDFGTGGAAGLVSSLPLVTSTGVAVSFTGLSGVYNLDVVSVTRSPFRDGIGGAVDQHYLNARAGANGGSITLSYGAPQTAFNLLWGSVDPIPSSYNQLTFTFTGQGGSETVTGADVVVGLLGVVNGTTNLAVSITNLTAFDTITITASQEAFEFVPGVPVPEPASLALLGLGLLGAGYVQRRRRH